MVFLNDFFSQSYVQLKYHLIKTMAEALAVRALMFKTTDFSKMLSSELYQLREETNDMIEKHGQDLDSLSRRCLEEGMRKLSAVLGERYLTLTSLRQMIPDVKKMMKETFPIGNNHQVSKIKAYVFEICSMIGRLRLVDTNKDEIDEMRQFGDDVCTSLPGLIAEKLARFVRKARELPLADLEYTILGTMAYEFESIFGASHYTRESEDDIKEARLILREIYDAQSNIRKTTKPELIKDCENRSHWACDGCDDCSTQHWKIV